MSADFFDSNVVLYLFDTDLRKRSIARQLVNTSLDNEAHISFQVVQEVLHRLSSGTPPRALPEEIDRVLSEILFPLWDVLPTEGLYRSALQLKQRYRYSFYDSLIIAAALEAGCTRLYSEDLQHGQRIERLTIVNPFA
jgi:predicted nucleic acid-binding protein